MQQPAPTAATFGQAGLFQAPAAPKTIAETGVSDTLLRSLVLKLFFVHGLTTASEICWELKIPRGIVLQLLEEATDRGLLEVLGLRTPAGTASELKYALTDRGRTWAAEALAQSQYVGPAPVSLSDLRSQVDRQRIKNETITHADLKEALSGLILPEKLIHLLGPAANSARSILLFGAPGNGKTSIAEAIGSAFKQRIFVPYCIEIDSQIIRIFDPTLHEAVEHPAETPTRAPEDVGAIPVDHDPRWVLCKRPVVMTGGELTLGMLDLVYSAISNFYEAPMQFKATGGIFIIDDFGRQLASPSDILNRWIIPLERGKDYLTLHTGKKFEVPFDELVVFSTNLPPHDLMDAAAGRRISYKIEVPPPTRKDYAAIFARVCAEKNISLPDDIVPMLFEEFYSKGQVPLGCYHPRSIVDQVLARCEYESIPPRLDKEFVRDAFGNISVA